MRHIILALAFMCFAVQAHAFSFTSTGGARDVHATRVLAQSSVAASVTGTVAETTLATYTLPAGILGKNGGIRVTSIWSFTNNGNNKTPRVRFGGTAVQANSFTTNQSTTLLTTVINRNSASSQLCPNTYGFYGGNGAPVTASINTAADVVITLTGNLANTGDTLTLEGYTIELLPGAN